MNKNKNPYTFYFLNELKFQNLIESNTNSEEYISTIGNIKEYQPDREEACLIFDNSTIAINYSRIANSFQIVTNKNTRYYIYGVLKYERKKPIIFINYYRLIESTNEELDAYKVIIERMRMLATESLENKDDFFGLG